MKKNIANSGERVSLIRQRYAENPFATEEGFRVPIRNRSEVIQTDGPAAVVVGTATRL